MQQFDIETIKQRTKELPPEQKVELIKFLADSLTTDTRDSTPLQFAKYKKTGRRMSTADDFTVAEWHPTNLDLNGN